MVRPDDVTPASPGLGGATQPLTDTSVNNGRSGLAVRWVNGDRRVAPAMATLSSPDPQGLGPTPPDNVPGHHPPVEQDKPTTPPPVPADPRLGAVEDPPARSVPGGRLRFPFAFSLRLAPAAAVFGVVPPTAHVDVDDRELSIRFGPGACARRWTTSGR